MELFRKKSLGMFQHNLAQSSLKKGLNAIDITLLGLGIIIGTGIFVLTGVVAADYAGPGIMLSFVLAGITCAFVALAYSELAAALPVAGSGYTYTYSTLGEIVAWLVGWGLILEYSVGSATVAVGWSAYLSGLLKSTGFHLPQALTAGPMEGGLINLPAMLIVGIITLLLIRGTKESARVNKILVFIKVAAIFIFLFLAAPSVEPANWVPVLPFGWHGVSAGTAVIFFSYIGFDCIATAAEETNNPNRDMPIGIIASLLICTLLYIAVSAVLTGVVPYSDLNNAEPVAYVLRHLGYSFGSALVGTGALCGLSTVILVFLFAQSRVFFAMSRDGLLPKSFSKVNAKTGTPVEVTLIVGTLVAIMAGLTPIHVIAEMTSAGTLFAFICSLLGVMILRKRHPELPRPFRCPALYPMATLGIVFCGYIFSNLSVHTFMLFGGWLFAGLLIYLFYGHKHSVLSVGSEAHRRYRAQVEASETFGAGTTAASES